MDQKAFFNLSYGLYIFPQVMMEKMQAVLRIRFNR